MVDIYQFLKLESFTFSLDMRKYLSHTTYILMHTKRLSTDELSCAKHKCQRLAQTFSSENLISRPHFPILHTSTFQLFRPILYYTLVSSPRRGNLVLKSKRKLLNPSSRRFLSRRVDSVYYLTTHVRDCFTAARFRASSRINTHTSRSPLRTIDLRDYVVKRRRRVYVCDCES